MFYAVITYSFVAIFRRHEDTWTSNRGYSTKEECLGTAEMIANFTFGKLSSVKYQISCIEK